MNESKLWQRRAGLITEDEYMEGMNDVEEGTGLQHGTMDKNFFAGTKSGTTSGNVNNPSKLAQKFRDLAQKLPSTTGMSGAEVAAVATLLDDIMSKTSKGEIAIALKRALTVFDQATKNVSE